MHSLSSADVRRLMAAIERIHAVRELEGFSKEVFRVLGELIPDALYSLDQLELITGEVRVNGSIVFPSNIVAKIVELLPSHPVMPAALAGARGAIRITDCITQRQFRETPHYHEYMKALGIEYQTVVPLDIPGHAAGITVNREKDFSDKESALITALAPHLALANTNLIRLHNLETTLASLPFPTPAQLEQVGFSPREGEILFWVMQGKRDCEIAEILSEKSKVSVRTVNNHLRNILAKTGAETRTGASLAVLEKVKEALIS